MINRGKDGYFHPINEEEIVELVQHARSSDLTVRVRGSAHSVAAAIHTGDFSAPPPSEKNINIYLDRLSEISFDDKNKQVTVGAGCHLGKDPNDPAGTSELENSLFYRLDQHGWAFTDTGGIIHQTVGGFLSTGSSGGSIHHSVSKEIVAFRLVDGLGKIHEFSKSDDLNDPFYAAGVSMGLLGIITSVTFQCLDRYEIAGKETTYLYEDCEIDLFGPGDGNKPGLDDFFRREEHSRLIWFPQKGVEKIVVWKAHKIKETPLDFKPKPYKEFPKLLGSTRNTQLLIHYLFHLFDWLNLPRSSGFIGRILRPFITLIYRFVVNQFVMTDETQEFQDTWWKGLPMDNNVDDRLIPIKFTELWIPLSKSMEVMQALYAQYQEGGFEASGTFACEIYATPSSDFWMSASYQQDVIKIDPFWIGFNHGDPDEVYFPNFWEKLKKHEYRLHWGKALSGDVDYLRKMYPRWDDFMQLREEMDPDQIFVTDYWQRHLGIESKSVG